ncbi:MAG: peptidoglycan DD-metalloendopeptidase family protein [Litorilinea sp.]
MSQLLELIRNLNIFRLLQRSRSTHTPTDSSAATGSSGSTANHTGANSGQASTTITNIKSTGAKSNDSKQSDSAPTDYVLDDAEQTAPELHAPELSAAVQSTPPVSSVPESSVEILTHAAATLSDDSSANSGTGTTAPGNLAPDETDAGLETTSATRTWNFGLSQSRAQRARHLPAGVQVGVVGLALLAVWWSWPLWANAERPFSTGAGTEIAMLERAPDAEAAATPPSAATRASLQTLAIVNPDNLPRPDVSEPLPAPDSAAPESAVPESAAQAATNAVQARLTQTDTAQTDAAQPVSATEAVTDTDSSTDAVGPESVSADSNETDTDAADITGENSDTDGVNADSAGDDTADAGADDAQADTEISFPEVGESDPDALTPFLLEVEIPASDAAQGDVVPAALTVPSNGQINGVQADLILLPTATPLADAGRLQAQAAQLPRIEIIPAVGVRFTPTPEPSPTVTPSPTPTPIPSTSGRGRLWSTFTPGAALETDHFWIGNPFEGISANRSASPSYQFGSTAGSRYRPHHGIDISNPSGTPVRAGVVGEVVHAGLDDPDLLGPYGNFYGNAVVILLDQRLPVAGGELDVFLLYGHLSEVRTTVGERVRPDDIVGLVGMTGIAIGPHLHVEVRLGANTYNHSVNPYLWMEPPSGSGTVAVRILTAEGHTWAGAKVSIARFDGGAAVWARQIETYLDTENIGPNPVWGENGAMGDVPAGTYYLIGNIEGEAIRAEFTVNAGETTFIEARTQQ